MANKTIENPPGTYWRGPVFVEVKPGRYIRPDDPEWLQNEYEARLRLGACSPLEKKET